MALHAQCNCGWNGTISEGYGGAKLHCPACGAGMFADTEAAKPAVPYGYKPYPTWQKRPAPTVPRYNVSQWRCADRRRSGAAFWSLVFGTTGLVLVDWGVCGVLCVAVGVVGLMEGVRGFAYARSKRRLPVLALIGLVMSMAAISVALMHDRPRQRGAECRGTPADCTLVEPEHAQHPAQPRCAKPVCQQDTVVTEPVTPRSEFERRQVEYSETVRKARGEARD